MEKYVDLINPSLDAGYMVISDKYKEESFVYSPLFGSRKEVIYPFIEILPNPDIYIYLDITPSVSYERLINRANTTNEKLTLKDKLENMENSKLKFDEFYNNNTSCYRIDANQKIINVHNDVIRLLKGISFFTDYTISKHLF